MGELDAHCQQRCSSGDVKVVARFRITKQSTCRAWRCFRPVDLSNDDGSSDGSTDQYCHYYTPSMAAELPEVLEQCNGTPSFALPTDTEHMFQSGWWAPERDGGLALLLHRWKNASIAVVGSSGNLRYRGHGAEIDSHDIVVRINAATTHGFEEDVGNRTTMRVSWSKGAKTVLHNRMATTAEIQVGRGFEDWRNVLPVSMQAAFEASGDTRRLPGSPLLLMLDQAWLECLHLAILRSRANEPSTGFDALALALALNAELARAHRTRPRPVSVYGFGACPPCAKYDACTGDSSEANGVDGQHPFHLEKLAREAWHQAGVIRLTEQSCEAEPGAHRGGYHERYAAPPESPQAPPAPSSSPSPPPPPPPSPSPPPFRASCQWWCEPHTQPWLTKCTFRGCSTCAPCSSLASHVAAPYSPPHAPPPSPWRPHTAALAAVAALARTEQEGGQLHRSTRWIATEQPIFDWPLSCIGAFLSVVGIVAFICFLRRSTNHAEKEESVDTSFAEHEAHVRRGPQHAAAATPPSPIAPSPCPGGRTPACKLKLAHKPKKYTALVDEPELGSPSAGLPLEAI